MNDEARIQTLLERMTVAEKIALCAGKNFWQTNAVERLGIKRLRLSDGPRGVAWHSSGKRGTSFPPAIALAASWDRDLALRFGQALGAEARAAGCGVILGPAGDLPASVRSHGQRGRCLDGDGSLQCGTGAGGL